MHTAEAARGRGVGSAMLRHIMAAARAGGMARLSLETGSWPYFEPARTLYARHGFVVCGPFGEYREDPNSVFMTAELHLQTALDEARQSLQEGGIPIGSVLASGDRILGRGHNRRVQAGSVVLHAEMDALERAGRQPASVYRSCTLYTTLSPCAMCTGAILLYGIPRVVVGENRTFRGEEDLLRSRGVVVEVVQDPTCERLLSEFIGEHPELWNEDIGR
jgi:cytosine deaminase